VAAVLGDVHVLWYLVLNRHDPLQYSMMKVRQSQRKRRRSDLVLYRDRLSEVLGVLWIFEWVGSHQHDVERDPAGPDVGVLAVVLSPGQHLRRDVGRRAHR
jgi:hypothetical protein